MVFEIGCLLIAVGAVVYARKKRNTRDEKAVSEKALLQKCSEIAKIQVGYDNRDNVRILSETISNRLHDIHQLAKQKEELDLVYYKSVKSIELFNLLCQMIQQNPILAERLRAAQEEQATIILQGMASLSDEQYTNYKGMLVQIVDMVRSDKFLPKQ